MELNKMDGIKSLSVVLLELVYSDIVGSGQGAHAALMVVAA